MRYLQIFIALFLFTSIHGRSYNDQGVFDILLDRYENVHVYSQHGDINISTHASNTGVVQYKRSLDAKSTAKLEAAKEEIILDTMSMDGDLVVFVRIPDYYLQKDDDGWMYHYRNDAKSYINSYKRNSVQYSFKLDIVLPEDTNLFVSNHHDDLTVDGIKGALYASNHHKGVVLKNVKDVRYVHSHHGDIEVDFTAQSQYEVEFDTHHGDVTLHFAHSPSLEVEFESYHGSIYTDFDWVQLPTEVRRVKSKRGQKYKVGNGARVAFGDGEKRMTFESHHGSFYILKG